MLIIYGLTLLSLAAIVGSSPARDDPVNNMLIGQEGISTPIREEFSNEMINDRISIAKPPKGTYLMSRKNIKCKIF